MNFQMKTGEEVRVQRIRGFLSPDMQPRVVCDLEVVKGNTDSVVPGMTYTLTIQELHRNGTEVRVH